MRRIVLLLMFLLVLAGCNTMESQGSLKFTDTGCAVGTKAGDEYGPSLLILKFDDGSLFVTRTNAEMNCAIKNGGIGCDVSFEGDVIHYRVYENDGHSANCSCQVEKMSSIVTGLELGKNYSFDYTCSTLHYYPFSFTFEKDLNMIIDMETMTPQYIVLDDAEGNL